MAAKIRWVGSHDKDFLFGKMRHRCYRNPGLASDSDVETANYHGIGEELFEGGNKYGEKTLAAFG